MLIQRSQRLFKEHQVGSHASGEGGYFWGQTLWQKGFVSVQSDDNDWGVGLRVMLTFVFLHVQFWRICERTNKFHKNFKSDSMSLLRYASSRGVIGHIHIYIALSVYRKKVSW